MIRTLARRSTMLAAFGLALAACGSTAVSTASTTGSTASTAAAPASSTATTAKAVKVVASTSWVAAYAKMAGATDVTYVAPNNVQHPPDYDPKPSDLTAVASADVILLAGFEGFAQRLKDAAGSKAKVDTVNTAYDPTKLGPEVLRLAAELGTDRSVAQKNIDAYTAAWNKESAEVKAKLTGKANTVVAQAFVTEWVAFAGYTPAGTYGPAPATPSEIANLVKLKPSVVFENVHMGGGADIASAAGVKKIDLVNFPGDDLDLTKVIAKDADLITAGLGA